MQSYKTSQVGGRTSQVGGITCKFKEKKRIIVNARKCKCFNYGKSGHFSKDCNQKPGKLRNKFKNFAFTLNFVDHPEYFTDIGSSFSVEFYSCSRTAKLSFIVYLKQAQVQKIGTLTN